jgi:hypothetical protein
MAEMVSEQGVATPATTSAAACKWCGGSNLRDGPGAGPHFARLECADCGRFLKWLPRPATANDAAGKAEWPSLDC